MFLHQSVVAGEGREMVDRAESKFHQNTGGDLTLAL